MFARVLLPEFHPALLPSTLLWSSALTSEHVALPLRVPGLCADPPLASSWLPRLSSQTRGTAHFERSQPELIEFRHVALDIVRKQSPRRSKHARGDHEPLCPYTSRRSS